MATVDPIVAIANACEGAAMTNAAVQTIYVTGGLVSAALLIWMLVTVAKARWAPWDDEEAVTSEPITPGLGADIVGILESRTGSETRVLMRSGQSYLVFNVAWGRDMGAEWEHISANISPFIEDASFDFFHTRDIVQLIDPQTNAVLYDRGLSKA